MTPAEAERIFNDVVQKQFEIREEIAGLEKIKQQHVNTREKNGVGLKIYELKQDLKENIEWAKKLNGIMITVNGSQNGHT